jgi:hypothetical protein
VLENALCLTRRSPQPFGYFQDPIGLVFALRVFALFILCTGFAVVPVAKTIQSLLPVGNNATRLPRIAQSLLLCCNKGVAADATSPSQARKRLL